MQESMFWKALLKCKFLAFTLGFGLQELNNHLLNQDHTYCAKPRPPAFSIAGEHDLERFSDFSCDVSQKQEHC